MTDDIISDDVIDYYVIAKSPKNDQSFKINSEIRMSPGVIKFPLVYMLIGKLINRHQVEMIPDTGFVLEIRL